MAITTYQQALAFANSPEGQAIPGMWDAKAQLIESHSLPVLQKYRPADIANIEKARQNPVQWQLNRSVNAVANYAKALAGGFDKNFAPSVKQNIINEYNKLAPYLIANKVPATQIQNVWKGAQQVLQTDTALMNKRNTFDYIFAVADTLILGGLTGGLNLTVVQSAALNSALAIANGANAEEAIRAGLGSIAASQVPDFLKNVNNLIPNDALYAGVVNAERQAVNALLTGQDPKQAALAGLAGGTTAGFLASDNAAIARASGEYIQALAAGRSPTDAMMSALSGFAQAEYDEAQKKILAEKQARDEGRTTIASDTATTPTTAPTGAVAGGAAAPTTGATGGTAALPEVTVTGTAPASTAGTNLSLLPSGQTKAPTTSSALPTVTVTGTPDNIASANLSLQSTATTTPEKTPEKVKTPEERAADTTLLSLLQPRTIFGPGGARSDPTRTSSTVGSQALAQALRVGDLGAPIFGRKEEGRRAGWNVESLRYMGNTEA